jgi:hypothetical protein
MVSSAILPIGHRNPLACGHVHALYAGVDKRGDLSQGSRLRLEITAPEIDDTHRVNVRIDEARQNEFPAGSLDFGLGPHQLSRLSCGSREDDLSVTDRQSLYDSMVGVLCVNLRIRQYKVRRPLFRSLCRCAY